MLRPKILATEWSAKIIRDKKGSGGDLIDLLGLDMCSFIIALTDGTLDF